ncbi:concanavalin A-like lectin/glucanase domain-containing protein [Paraphoma chrysanthemicola]|uniref:Concanavalin A-like lectin/glucanase domain-containing protein n=1 Tax=Paraphoma chrysanthemicola TaxID=798071 RepID=A0A8K0VWQ9_9PLEO|nr:concanavalin A-like lectin/glucanase domain-containing protein [Paraphoma chrysanthemicola]
MDFYGILTLVALAAVGVSALPDTSLCGQYQNITDSSGKYTFSTNVWGLDNSGGSCVEITDDATALSTTWSWAANDTLVHAYPNINLNAVQRDPIPLSDLSAIDVKVSWSMKPTLSTAKAAIDESGLTATDAKTNVAIDVFFDERLEKAVNTTAPSFEVMVWIGKFGSILPIGANATTDVNTLPMEKVGGRTFHLYQGPNDNGQYVFSWVSDANITDFDADISPLVHYLWRHGMVLAANYVGVIQFGTEQKHATSNVTFSVDDFAMSATRGTPKAAAGLSLKHSPPLQLMSALVAIVAVAIL